MRHIKIGALIAAAGQSRRMGFPKACLPIDGMPLLMYSLNKWLKMPFEQIVVTLPPNLVMDEDLHAQCIDEPVMSMPNRFAHEGYAGSIKTALLAMPHIDGIMVSPIDAPLISTHVLKTLLAIIHDHGDVPLLLVPHVFHYPGHPVYMSRHFFNEYGAYSDLPWLREILARHKAHKKAVMWPDESILYNLNNLASLRYFFKQNPGLKMGDAAAIEAPGANFS